MEVHAREIAPAKIAAQLDEPRPELDPEGEPAADATWREYEFKGKPGDPGRLPPQVAPYHLRLDWLLWFIPLSPSYGGEWFLRFLLRLLEGDPATLRLLRRDPFAAGPPLFIRVRLFHYRYSTFRERRATGDWWVRTFASDYIPAVGLHDFVRRDAV